MVLSFMETERALGEYFVVPSAALITLNKVARVLWSGRGRECGLFALIQGVLSFSIHTGVHHFSNVHISSFSQWKGSILGSFEPIK